jgi:hypothetical protein
MAIRNPTSQDKATISVFTLGKKKFIDCDIPSSPFATEGMVSFWDGDKLIGLPIAQIERLELNFNES